MDPQLKQRLIGVTIVVALAVIFVPMLFEKSDDKGKLSSTGIPSLPDDVLEKNIELPKTAEDISPKDDEEKKPVDTGYKMVPMEDEAPPKPKPKIITEDTEKPAQVKQQESPFVPEEEAGNAKPNKFVKKDRKASDTVPLKAPEAKRPEEGVRHFVQPKSVTPTVKLSKPSPTGKSHKKTIEPNQDMPEEPAYTHVKTDKTLTKKPKSLTEAATKQTDDTEKKSVALKNTANPKPLKIRKPVVKESRPKSNPNLLPDTDRDLDEEPIPAPAKPEAPKLKAKPKTTAHSPSKPSGSQEAANKTDTAKSPTVKSQTVKVEKPKTSPATDASKPAVKPKKPKPVAPVKPVQPDEPEKLKPQTMAPSALMVLVGTINRLYPVQDFDWNLEKPEIFTAV
ncbi:MAG: hypothetical protein ACOYMG_17900 [Candidatus Methylumidiphilus sp.]